MVKKADFAPPFDRLSLFNTATRQELLEHSKAHSCKEGAGKRDRQTGVGGMHCRSEGLLHICFPVCCTKALDILHEIKDTMHSCMAVKRNWGGGVLCK